MKRKRQADTTSDQPGPARRARKIQAVPRGAGVIEGTGEAASQAISKSPNKPKKAPRQKDEERRLRAFRSKPPQTYLVKLFVLRRTRGGTEEVPEEYIDIAGSTGNIYQVVIGKEPSCTCPDAKKGNQCKHVVYVGSMLQENPYIFKSLS
ncbi:RING finger domain protein (Znf1), putative [Trichophyton benhamiae CBS 112371]|uniref:RING finger domain protein (Znf1), putative n=1 Tax=Arthroderma benhamiae (strain ATCC MYA-4681 / CBS 112371) TaxID=663331 RepID=D4AZR4_ARTBC|nr:RING finger domain protein (Znf1), putative [Trichophyton benhamiae CBS 112371]EFE31534.1 RING finger domain protein (Znf1), putative [Trichophyton benhamiae CBS 112371]